VQIRNDVSGYESFRPRSSPTLHTQESGSYQGTPFQACRNSALMSRAFRRRAPNLGSSQFPRDTRHIQPTPSRIIVI